ncbi:MAG: tetraacyldisaccharide 4'-kinase [Planctomycetota bacterium]|nr:tetraacyldisaccharide 4'-kinase [Planctomycetota bacterium]MDP6761349.1 tetraacyldisaccharide 4'-kinase [Planctomycetota bacterium]MDP6990844.1 tetraacyldisaccharide 4'-kinase [Planctomycetota bacterium]
MRFPERLAGRGGALEWLRIPSALYDGVTRARNAAYNRGWRRVGRLDVPVVSVGNLTVGGTGKTPAVIWLARELLERGRRPGILSRGYRRGAERLNDEGRLIAREVPEALQEQDPDRLRGGRRLVERGAEVVVLDDGFQHRRLARDLDLVLVDATRPFGLPADGTRPAPRWCLPRGLLRERPEGLRRADAVIVTRADSVPGPALDNLTAELHELAPALPLARAVHRPVRLRGAGGERPPEWLRGRRVRLACGLANPEAFAGTVGELGAEVVGVEAFGDHHRFVPSDLADLAREGETLVVTAKDAVKLEDVTAAFLVLDVEFTLLEGAALLDALLDALPPGRAERERGALHAGLSG